MKPSLTIFADASLHAKQRIVGWAGWARGDARQSIIASGHAPSCDDSTVAELWALALFADRLRSDGYMTLADESIILQSDSLNALRAINSRIPSARAAQAKDNGVPVTPAKKINPREKEPLDRIANTLDFARVIYLRHVRGHEGGSHSRSWVNEQCDRLAKREARAQLLAASPYAAIKEPHHD